MSNIINKSNHPVQIKRINVRIWKFRDEIEKAIALRLMESNEQGIELNIEDIKKFYSRKKPKYLDPNYDPEDDDESEEDEIGTDGQDSSGNVMDKESLEVKAAMGGEEDKTETTKTEKDDKPDEEKDDEAVKLAAEMLGDQASATPEEEDEVPTKLAAEILGDQGSSSADTEADALDSSMLSDKGSASETQKKELQRVVPDEDHISYGFALLSDLNMDEMLVFSKDGYKFGQNICVEFLIPKEFTISGEVVGVIHLGRTSKIISETKNSVTKPNKRR